jgi:nucleotide-binding universal stress UspA family protein
MFKKIVLALDGSPPSDRAFALVKGLVGLTTPSVTVVHVREMMIAPAVGGVPRRIDEESLQAKIQGQVDELNAAGAEAELRVVVTTYASGPAHDIASVAKEVGADLIAVGTRGQGLISGLLLGSVTQRLLQIAPCPILAAPMDETVGG